ncbi:hypothetical protein NLJ89_g12213 [Agrocybe chaxingu]|uniref:Uncharacterized protein n=1 Tax=Agrocybe chaxingu TaxID=84603 RepID=A0A9W8JMA5_9AGAR|nr:hypothetical protein NLJ89_g12213 [Agrocybe chaxingu]
MHERDYRQADQLHFQTNSHTNGISSSHNAQAARVVPPPPAPPPPPAIHPPKPKPIRRGFWNRRGDHLTQSGYIVYAPPHRTFPEELQNYPAEDEGYQDETEVFSSCYPRRPELPDSLPRMGKPPDRPYDSFVVYLTPEEAKRAREAVREKAVAPRFAA